MRRIVLAGLCGVLLGAGGAAAQVDVLTYHNDLARTGQNLAEVILNTDNVNPDTFGRLFVRKVIGDVYAQPLIVAGVEVPGKGVHDVVYVATQADYVYAFDAHSKTGANKKPLWRRKLKPPGAKVILFKDTECDDIVPKIGITGTPVIDKATGTLYVVARTHEGKQFVQRLYALDIATGADKLGGPLVIDPTVPGEGMSSVDGVVHFEPLRELQRCALLLRNGIVYVAWASQCDTIPYHGWVVGYDTTGPTLTEAVTWCSTPDGHTGGIWMSGCAPSVDSQGRIFFGIGNGSFTANTGGADFGDSIMALDADLNVLDYFTPFNQQELSDNDDDLGSSGVLIPPNQTGAHPHIAIAAGKEGTIYVLDRENMGHFNPVDDSQIVQSLPGGLSAGAFDTPAWFDGKVYFHAAFDVLRVFTLSGGLLSTQPAAQSTLQFRFPGATPSISANVAAEGIVWETHRDVGDGIEFPYRLHAFDAQDVSVELYDSASQGKAGDPGPPIKFTVPTVANGKVYVGGHNRLVVYGLLPD